MRETWRVRGTGAVLIRASTVTVVMILKEEKLKEEDRVGRLYPVEGVLVVSGKVRSLMGISIRMVFSFRV